MDQPDAITLDEINAFCATLAHLEADQVKGGIATTGVFTPEALRVAMSQGLTVVRLMPPDRVKPLLYRPVYRVGIHNAEQTERRQRAQAERALTDSQFKSIAQSVFALSPERYFNDLSSLLASELPSDLR